MGKYPVEAVDMLAKIAAAIEPHRPRYPLEEALKTYGGDGNLSLTDLVALSVQTTLERVSPAAVIVPTRSGYTARDISSFRPTVWIVAVSSEDQTCQELQFSYGVHPVNEPDHPEDWKAFARQWLKSHGVEGNLVVLTEGPSRRHPEANNRMELIDLSREG
jgi:pyruvate kinase